MRARKLTSGIYEAKDNILHLWYPRRVELSDEAVVQAFFEEVVDCWIKACPRSPYLLVNYENVRIRANMVEAYASNIAHFQPMILGTYRYGVHESFTGVTVALGNLNLNAPVNIFADESTARSAIRAAQMKADTPKMRRAFR